MILAIGVPAIIDSPRLRQQLNAQLLVFTALGGMQVLYSSFGSVFNQLTGYEQTVFAFVLPLIKFVVTQFVARAYTHFEECVGLQIVFSANLCHVLYLASCMQTATSLLTTILVMSTDAFFVLLALHSIYKQSQIDDSNRESYLETQIRLVLKVCHDVYAVPSKHVRLRARFPLPLSKDSISLLEKLLKMRDRNAQPVSDRQNSPPSETKCVPHNLDVTSDLPGACDTNVTALKGCTRAQQDEDITRAAGSLFHQLIQIASSRLHAKVHVSAMKASNTSTPSSSSHSMRMVLPIGISSSPTAICFQRHGPITQDVEDALQALFHSEYILMTEYVECAVPILYSVYVAVVYQLPIAAYYPQTSSMNLDRLLRTLISIVLYAMLEFGSFLVLNVLLKRRFGFFPLYQLAFVLETHAQTVQSFLFIWVLSGLEMNLVHNSADVVAPSK